jgi:hypothetical protein
MDKKHKIAVLVRGHERNSLDKEFLKNYLKYLNQYFNIDVFIHTWEENEAKSSYRSLKKCDKIITNELILNYFNNEINIKKILIDKETDIELIGNTEGKISLIPKIAWKKMWFGQYRGINEIMKYDYDLVLNIRFDHLNDFHKIHYQHDGRNYIEHFFMNMDEENTKIKLEEILQNIENKIYFGRNYHCFCIDNVFIGKPNIMYNLICNFHKNLDSVISKYPNIFGQEKLVFLLAQEMQN